MAICALDWPCGGGRRTVAMHGAGAGAIRPSIAKVLPEKEREKVSIAPTTVGVLPTLE